MGKHRINEDGNIRSFDTDEEYYAYKRVRSKFESLDDYDNARAYFSSDYELYDYLVRKEDDGYQHWLAYHGGKQFDSNNLYQEYLKRSGDTTYQQWLNLNHRFSEYDYDERYNKYLEEKALFNSEEAFSDYIFKEIEKRDIDEERQERKQKTKRIINIVFCIIIIVLCILSVSFHLHKKLATIIIVVLFLLKHIITKKIMDNII